MKAGKDLRGGGQQKGQSQEGQAHLKGGEGCRERCGRRFETGRPMAESYRRSTCSFLGCTSPAAPQSSTLALSFPVGQVTPSVLSPSFAGESKQNEKREQAQSYEGVDVSPTAWQ